MVIIDNDEESEFEALRRKNIEEKSAFLASFKNDPLFVDLLNKIEEEKERVIKPQKPAAAFNNKRKRGDSTFKFTGTVPIERRSSSRLQNKKPDFTAADLPDDKYIGADDDDDLEGLENVVFRPKKARKSTNRSVLAPVIPVEEVTDEMIQKIHLTGNKTYGAAGTSCHQCRQKTIDTKTICRSGSCVGVRGQFCGICVVNRYGEDPAEALRDPKWQCYVCRGICNCSFCRARAGKRPTGILTPLAKMKGFKSVLDFLNSLNGYGDYAEPLKNPENLLGFDGNCAVMGGNKREELNCDNDAEVFNYFRKELEKDPEKLLGFNGNDAVVGENNVIKLKCDYDAGILDT